MRRRWGRNRPRVLRQGSAAPWRFCSRRWASLDRLLGANLVEHRIQAAVDAPCADRFSAITASTVVLGAAKSPAFVSRQLVTELAGVIPDATAAILPSLSHLASEQRPERSATVVRTHCDRVRR
jgi:hypothetical protein